MIKDEHRDDEDIMVDGCFMVVGLISCFSVVFGLQLWYLMNKVMH